MTLAPTGCIHTPHKAKADGPIQSVYAAGPQGRVEVYAPYAAGLKEMENLSHTYLALETP